MIRNQNFVCLALTTWEKEFSNTLVQMMTILSRENKVLFVDYEYTIKDILDSWTGKKNVPVNRMFGKEDRLRTVPTRFGSQVHVLTPPPVLPVNWIRYKYPHRVLLQVNAQLIKGTVKKVINRLGMDNPIIVNGYNPFFGLPLAGAFREKLNVYYCYDEIKGDQWYNFHGPGIEAEYISKTDLVITTSEGLHYSKSPLHPHCFVVKNGVDFELFNRAADLNIPSVHASKKVGYTGSVDERFDTALMCYVIAMLPEVEFSFTGRVTNKEAGDKLSQFPNVRFNGSKRSEEMPDVIKEIDAGIIPYLKNKVTSGVYPLKINEYLAAGKPVVMTDFARLSEFEGLVRFASDKEEFLFFLREEIFTDSTEKRKQRIKLAEKNSWENKAEEFSSILERTLSGKMVRL